MHLKVSSDLHKRLKPVVWSLKIVDKVRGGANVVPSVHARVHARACGFCVTPNGYIMTCGRIFMDFDSSKMQIWACRLDEDNFIEAKLVLRRPQWDLALVKVQVMDSVCGCFSNEGMLSVGQPILYIGHSSHFAGSCIYGYVAFGCTDVMSVPPVDENMNCAEFYFNPYAYTTSQSPNPSNMGCYWNMRVFYGEKDIRNTDHAFRKQLHPHVPVILCDGFSTNRGGQFGISGSPGSPVFNLLGDIVGMLSSQFGNSDIAVHVSALLKFQTDSLTVGPAFSIKVCFYHFTDILY